MKELKNVAWKPRAVMIASRDHLCINSTINELKGSLLNAACSSAQKGLNPCVYYKNKDQAHKKLSWDPMDIEDLHIAGKEGLFCPYFAMKERLSGADIIMMPYNYLIDQKIRENFDVNFTNSVIIIDEAHNIAKTCEDSSSFSIDTLTLDAALRELNDLKDVIRLNKDQNFESTEEGIEHLQLLTKTFKQFLQHHDFRK